MDRHSRSTPTLTVLRCTYPLDVCHRGWPQQVSTMPGQASEGTSKSAPWRHGPLHKLMPVPSVTQDKLVGSSVRQARGCGHCAMARAAWPRPLPATHRCSRPPDSAYKPFRILSLNAWMQLPYHNLATFRPTQRAARALTSFIPPCAAPTSLVSAPSEPHHASPSPAAALHTCPLPPPLS